MPLSQNAELFTPLAAPYGFTDEPLAKEIMAAVKEREFAVSDSFKPWY